MALATERQIKAICLHLAEHKAPYSDLTMIWLNEHMTFQQAKNVLARMMPGDYDAGYQLLKQYGKGLFV